MRAVARNMAVLAAAAFLTASGAYAAEVNVKVEKFSEYDAKYRGFEAKIVTPALSGLAISSVQNELNDRFAERAQKLESQFQKEAFEMLRDSQAEDGHMGVVLDYVIKTDNDKYLAFDLYEMNIAGSSSTTHSLYTFDKRTGNMVELKSIFNFKSDFTRVISDYIKVQMKRRNRLEKAGFFIAPDPDGFSSIGANPQFYINDKGNIVICFDKYQYAPGATGSPEFEIPRSVIAPYLAK